jgi:hypothetical protein
MNCVDDLSTASNSRDPSRSPLSYLRCLESGPVLCFGSLPNISVQIRNDPLIIGCRFEDTVALELIQKDDNIWIKHAKGDLFGCLNRKVSQGLKRLKKLAYICVEAHGAVALSELERSRASW